MTIPRLRLLPRARTGGYGNCNSPRITGMCLWLKSPLGHQQRPQLVWGFLRFWGVGDSCGTGAQRIAWPGQG